MKDGKEMKGGCCGECGSKAHKTSEHKGGSKKKALDKMKK